MVWKNIKGKNLYLLYQPLNWIDLNWTDQVNSVKQTELNKADLTGFRKKWFEVDSINWTKQNYTKLYWTYLTPKRNDLNWTKLQ